MLFIKARKAGLKVTVHTGEMENYPDNDDIIAFKPDRLGHGALLSSSQVEQVKSLAIPIECCPTSNVNILGLISYNQLPNVKWMKESNHTFSLCTDDTSTRYLITS